MFLSATRSDLARHVTASTQFKLATATAAAIPTGTKLANIWSSATALTQPTADSTSYLTLTSDTPFTIDFNALKSQLATVPTLASYVAGRAAAPTIAIPNPTGGYDLFRVVESQTLAAGIAAKYTDIRTFTGQGITDPTASLAMDFTSQGFHASVRTSNGDYFIDPYYYNHPEGGEVAYYTKDEVTNQTFTCLTKDDGSDDLAASVSKKGLTASPASVTGTPELGGLQRNYRIAIGATGEYTAFQGGTVDGALAAIATTVSRMNQIWERDFSIHCTLVDGETSVIYTNAATDPYTAPTNPTTTNNNNETALDTNVGSANYDIGHVYYKCAAATGNNGLAGGIGTVGTAGTKGKGYTAFVTPVGDDFVIDYAIHELGHEMGGRHTYNNINNANGDSNAIAVEVGAGTTIMGYAGLGNANTNVTIHSDAEYHSANYISPTTSAAAQILQYTLTNTASNGYTSAAKTSNGNTAPVVTTEGASYSIPTSTPFALTASGTDVDGDSLTYDWEQLDGSAAVAVTNTIPSSTTTVGPVFRTFLPTVSPTRSFPLQGTVLTGGTSDNGEQLPAVARNLHFAIVLRDNHLGGGGVSIGTVNVATVNTGSTFAVTTANTAGTSFDGGSQQTISWNVAGTTGSGINTANVKISLSTDGGNTFSTVLANSTPNDGSETLTLPNINTTMARIKIEAVGNIFYDINNANFSINVVTPAFAVLNNGVLTVTGTANADVLSLSTSGGNIVAGLGSATLSFDATQVNTIVVNALGGTDTLTFNGPISQPVTFNSGGENDTLTVSSGTFTFAANASTTAPNLTINVASGASVAFNASQTIASLNLAGTATASVMSGGDKVLSTQGLSIGASATLDLNDNDLIVEYSGPSQLSTITSEISSARTGGTWSGTGLTSSSAAANSLLSTTLGAMEASDYEAIYSGNTFDGVPIDSTAILVKYTYNGDADFSGKVDANDYGRIDSGYQNQSTPGFTAGWLTGDFDYNGKIDANDYGLIDSAYQTQSGIL